MHKIDRKGEDGRRAHAISFTRWRVAGRLGTIDLSTTESIMTPPPSSTTMPPPVAPAPFGRGRQSLGDSIWYAGWLLTFLATGEDTGGEYALIDAHTRKGNAPPPHLHRLEDESFYILEGEMTATIGNQKIKGAPGTLIFAPRNVVHSLDIHSEQIRMLILLTPAGLEGYFRQCSVPAPSLTLPPPTEIPYGNIEQLKAVALKYGIESAAPAP
jgi:quercetin dioxygenase-like cupin family protein